MLNKTCSASNTSFSRSIRQAEGGRRVREKGRVREKEKGRKKDKVGRRERCRV